MLSSSLLLPSSNGILDASELARIVSLMEYSFTVGFLLGGMTSGRQALLQFNAEHQHLLPLKKRSDFVMWVRNRNYRVMASFGTGGTVRGAQMAGVCALFSAVRITSASIRNWARVSDDVVWLDDVLAGMAAGGLFAWAGRGHRIYYLRKGVVFGGFLGGTLAILKLASQKSQITELNTS